MSWRIDPETFKLSNPDEPKVYTAAEFARQEWPPCPNCGTRIEVKRIRTPDLTSLDHYIRGRAECPQGCGPRR